MREKEINVAIAEILGIQYDELCSICGETLKDGNHIIYGPDEENSVKHYFVEKPLPDFCNDLNAMATAEKTLKKVRQRGFGSNLSIATERYKSLLEEFGDPVFATAKQRAIAFLKARGKWKE